MPVSKWKMMIHQMEWASRFFKQTHLSACKRYHHIRILPARNSSVKCCLIYTNYNVCVYVYIYTYLVGGFKHGFYFPYMGCHPNPIDELHHFSRWLLHHQHIQLSDAFGWSSYRLQFPPWPVTISRTSMRHIMTD